MHVGQRRELARGRFHRLSYIRQRVRWRVVWFTGRFTSGIMHPYIGCMM